MPELINNLVADVRKNRFSFLPKLSHDDIISVWDAVSNYIEQQMQAQKGVTIPGFGTFTFILKRLDIGNNKFILLQRPVFLLSEKFAQTHALQYTRHHTTGEVPVVSLNFTAISVDGPFDRDTVEACVREILLSISRAVANQQSVEFLFRGIGVLYIKDMKVKTRFFKDFLNSMDESGNLTKLMENRPGTADSVMSTQTTLTAQNRPCTSTLTLPKLNGARDLLPPIHEDVADTQNEKKTSLPPAQSTTIPPPDNYQKNSDTLQGNNESEKLFPSEKKVETLESRIPTPPQRTSPRVTKSAGMVQSTQTPRKISEKVDDCVEVEAPAKPIPPVGVNSVRSQSVASSQPCSSIHHHRAGQELCYVCMQRSMRNIPVSWAEERRRKELEQDALLQQYQQMKDQEAILLEKASQNSMRHSNQKVAAYNLGVAQGARDVKKARNTEFVKSYVFQNRPLTPLRFYKQDEYNKALETQVKMKRSREEKEKLDREFQERLEQVQLAEDLAAQRERFLREKAEQVSQYQRALSAQIRSKPLPLPKAESDSTEPVFGKHDATNTKLFEQRERSRNLLQDQLNTISKKKKDVILEELTKQKEESEMLARTKKELISDRIGVQKRSFEMRKALEKNWRDHHKSKLSREEQERLRFRSPGMLLLQQTDPYRRCGQCQRGMHNCGESNIWTESRYIPGSRLMV